MAVCGDHTLLLFVMCVHSYSCATVDVVSIGSFDHQANPLRCRTVVGTRFEVIATVGRRLASHADGIHEATWSSIGTTLNSYGD